MNREPAGVALILVSGLLTLFALLAAAVTGGTRFAAAGADGARREREAMLAAESGVNYAVARLLQDPRVRARWDWRADNACDDWQVRGFEPLDEPAGRLMNPSYSRARWDDRPPLNGILEPSLGEKGENVCSGRLRGATDHDRFFLRVRSAAGLININSGELGSPWDDERLDGVLNRDDPGYVDNIDAAQEALKGEPFVPDWRDVWVTPNLTAYEQARRSHPNVHLKNVLDNLGALVGVSTRRTALYGGTDPSERINKDFRFETSDLGWQVISNRPRGGYRSVDDLRPVLGEADYRLTAPYLAVTGEVVPVRTWREMDESKITFLNLSAQQDWFYQRHGRIDLNTAPIEVVAAALMYITASGCGRFMETAPDSDNYRITTESPFVRLSMRDAAEAADAIRDACPLATWEDLLRALLAWETAHPDHRMFDDDPFSRDLDEAHVWRPYKQDLILAAMNANPYIPDPFMRNWNSLGIEREETSSAEGIDFTRARRVRRAQLMNGAFLVPSPLPFNKNGRIPDPPIYDQESVDLPFSVNDVRFPFSFLSAPVPFSLSAIPQSFSIESEGGIASGRGTRIVSADLALDSLLLTSQQDFTQIGAFPNRPWWQPGASVYCDGSVPSETVSTQVHPRFPHTSIPYAAPLRRDEGQIRLALRQWTAPELSGDVVFALPFNEDRLDLNKDPEPGTRYDPAKSDDNTGDPLLGIDGNGNMVKRTIGGSAGSALVGTLLSPCGIRCGPHALEFTWGGSYALPFPLDKADFTDPDGNVTPRGGEITSGTVTFWYPARGGEDVVPGRLNGRFSFVLGPTGNDRPPPPPPPPPGGDTEPDPDDGGGGSGGGGEPEWEPQGEEEEDYTPKPDEYVAVRTDADDALWIWDGFAEHRFAPARPPASSWRHAALVFDKNDRNGNPLPAGDARILVYVDGEPASPEPDLTVTLQGRSMLPANDKVRLRVTHFPIDDLLIHKTSLPSEAIRRMALDTPRYHANGRYVSPRFTFNPEKYPHGAVLRGAAWDAFIPQGIGGAIQFTIYGYGENDQDPIDERSFSWQGHGSLPSVWFEPIRGCRHVRVQIILDATTPVLKETPILDEIRLLFTPR